MPYSVTINLSPPTAEAPSTISSSDHLKISYEEYIELNTCLFNWADSYDDKDWSRLAGIIAPTLKVDYTDIGKPHWPAMNSEEFLAMVSSPLFLGDPTVKTQHLMGASVWKKVTPDYVIGTHQLRAAHQVYTDASRTEVRLKGHGHATNEHYYRKVDGKWKFAGLKPRVRWNEYDFEKVFKGSYVEGLKGAEEKVMMEKEANGKAELMFV